MLDEFLLKKCESRQGSPVYHHGDGCFQVFFVFFFFRPAKGGQFFVVASEDQRLCDSKNVGDLNWRHFFFSFSVLIFRA